jgi:hypothetical protein
MESVNDSYMILYVYHVVVRLNVRASEGTIKNGQSRGTSNIWHDT